MKNSLWNEPGSLANIFWERDWDAEDPATSPIPIYDMHGHMGPHNAIYFKRCEAEEMCIHMKRIGVKRLVFSHHNSLWADFRSSQVCDICREHPEILRFYVAINPHRPALIDEDLALYDDFAPMVAGIKLLPDYHRFKVTDKEYEKPLVFANERKLPVLVHTWGGSPFDGGEVMYETAKRYPDIKLFCGHSIRGDNYYIRKIAEECPNVYFELTSVPGCFGLLEEILANAGEDRIIFGTDMPWFDEFAHVGGVLSANISDEAKRKILYKNVERLLGSDW